MIFSGMTYSSNTAECKFYLKSGVIKFQFIIIIMSGTSAGGASDQVFVLNKLLNLWKTVAPIPEKVESPSIFRNVDEMIYLLTGTNKQFRFAHYR